ncbi:MAG TPA: hypothetical protein PKX64_09565, partial [Elusimicrobiota bacterium]|nr:hypothetical protein [Elusimicrobiota bacterium]
MGFFDFFWAMSVIVLRNFCFGASPPWGKKIAVLNVESSGVFNSTTSLGSLTGAAGAAGGAGTAAGAGGTTGADGGGVAGGAAGDV